MKPGARSCSDAGLSTLLFDKYGEVCEVCMFEEVNSCVLNTSVARCTKRHVRTSIGK